MHSMLSSTLSSLPVIIFVVRKEGGHSHCHQTGCWVSCCVIWEAKCQISGFVWFLELLHLRAWASWEGCYEWQWSGGIPTPLHEWSSQMRQGWGYIRIWSVLENQRWWHWIYGWLGLTTECTDERLTQNAYYCGYDCDTMVINVTVFGPNGKVFFLCDQLSR
jgi:hypothetical protein